MKQSIIIIMLACTGMLGCKTNKNMDTKSAEVTSGCIQTIHPKELENRETGTVQILKANFRKDEIHLQLEYSGCGNEELYLAWSGAYMKSLPAKVNLNPGVIYGEARCRALITKDVCFNVKNIIDPMRKSGLIFLIEGLDEPITVNAEK